MLPDTILEGLESSSRLVVLTGSGISADSGVPTFRGPEGEWRGMRSEQLATPEAFRRDPKLVWEWYDMLRGKVAACHPNAAHEALARLGQAYKHAVVITQNVDGLHRSTGTSKLIELHGDIFRMRCVREGTSSEDRSVPLETLPPRCSCGELLRPDVVWFGEALEPAVIEQALNAARAASLLLVVGTSTLVEPAASLPYLAVDAGSRIVEINLERTPLTAHAHVFLEGHAVEHVPPLVDALLAQLP